MPQANYNCMADADVGPKSIVVADLIVGMEDLELHHRCRRRFNFRNFRIATIAVRMVSGNKKHININNFGRLSRDWGGWHKFVYAFWGAHSSHKQNPQKTPG